jgi:hypothetical protein
VSKDPLGFWQTVWVRTESLRERLATLAIGLDSFGRLEANPRLLIETEAAQILSEVSVAHRKVPTDVQWWRIRLQRISTLLPVKVELVVVDPKGQRCLLQTMAENESRPRRAKCGLV